MKARSILLAAAAWSLTSSAPAQPAKNEDGAKANAASKPQQPVILASADRVASGPGEETRTAPSKHRAARVTTCRCGGDPRSQPQAETEPEQ